ncbi:MAG TPA: formate dehydrogenase subunit delta [Burkholderiaceae bacterium]|nr:formate dehydrogenase subunit delta [Burkholderiaceae bacterium]
MNNDNLIRMVNRIGTFFAAMPDREEAMSDIAQHVRRFWEPRMRKQLFEHLDTKHGEGVDAIVVDALARHRALFS